MQPITTFTIKGEVEDFTRVDNLYRTLKREGLKLLKNVEINISVEYIEKVGEGEIP